VKAFFKKSANGGFYPNDEETQKYFKNRKPGVVIVAEVKIARNYGNHCRFFKFLETTFDMQDFYTEEKHYRKWLTMKCGYYDAIVTPKGDTIFVAQSISFENMEEPEFKKLFSSAINVFLKEFGQGMTEQEILRVIDYD